MQDVDPQPTLAEMLEKATFKELLKRVNKMTCPERLVVIITQAEARLKQLDPEFKIEVCT